MIGSRRDDGLVRGLGTWGLGTSIVSMIVGAGIFAVPGALAASVGAYAPLAFVVCGIAIGAVAICFAEGGSRVATSGGAYGYIEVALGPLAGYVCGTLLWVGDALGAGGVVVALADIASSMMPPFAAALARPAVIVGVVGAIALVNIGGLRQSARLVEITTVAKLVPLAIFVVAGAIAMHRSNFVLPHRADIESPGRAMVLALFAMTGMEIALCASGEVAEPARTIPRAIAFALITVTALYVGVQAVAQGILGAALASSTVPLADAMARIDSPLRVLMLTGAGLSMLGSMVSDGLGSPRVLFALGRDGLLPRALGRLHPRTHTPYVAILCYAALVIALALTGTFATLAVLSALAIAVIYIAGCLAAWRLACREVALAGAPLNFRWLRGAMLTGILGMLILIALATWAQILGILLLIAACAAVYRLQAARGTVSKRY